MSHSGKWFVFLLFFCFLHLLYLILTAWINPFFLPVLPILGVLYFSAHGLVGPFVLAIAGVLTDILFGSLIGQHAVIFLLLDWFFADFYGQRFLRLKLLPQFFVVCFLMLIYWLLIGLHTSFFPYWHSVVVVLVSTLFWLPFQVFLKQIRLKGWMF